MLALAFPLVPPGRTTTRAMELALKMARESMVLLKNDGVLPLAAGVKKILVVGPLAESAQVLHGNYSGTASHAVTALEGIRKQFAGAQR